MELNLKIRRGKLKLTIGQLSQESNVGYSTISQIENGKINPHVKTLIKLDDCLRRLEEHSQNS